MLDARLAVLASMIILSTASCRAQVPAEKDPATTAQRVSLRGAPGGQPGRVTTPDLDPDQYFWLEADFEQTDPPLALIEGPAMLVYFLDSAGEVPYVVTGNDCTAPPAFGVGYYFASQIGDRDLRLPIPTGMTLCFVSTTPETASIRVRAFRSY